VTLEEGRVTVLALLRLSAVEAEECRTVERLLVCSAPDHRSVTAGWVAFGLWAVSAVLCIYAGRDMERRGQSGGLWGGVVLFGGPLGIIVWRMVRTRLPLVPKQSDPTSPYGAGVPPGSLPWHKLR
jgi:hypothetical protein